MHGTKTGLFTIWPGSQKKHGTKTGLFTEASPNQGIKESRNQGIKESRNQGILILSGTF